ncbi:two-pore potassium channel 5-like [Canna indica]|uniref:Two-pore potassium channel 5-like n=1 Tax=Canna indica TaxID=4628 RepID=A0AAQ3JVY7_9LILI|nr:two-pore potassium channel 5-like [Canna indica]
MERAKQPLLLTHHSSPLSRSEIEDPFIPISSSPSPCSTSNSGVMGSPSIPRSKSNLHRTRTAPAMSVIRDGILPFRGGGGDGDAKNPGVSSSSSIVKQASALLLVYLFLGVLVYSTNPQGFSGVETHAAVDAFYFCIVTLCTIGYGDIAPLTPATKVFACVFVLVGFGLIDVLLAGAVSYVLDLQESAILASARGDSYLIDVEKGRMRIRMKVALAVGVVVLCIGAGVVGLYLLEGLNWVDAMYLSVMSVTTVGYGDHAFKTMTGRIFASFWLLLSTLAVARAFLYLAEARINKRHRMIVKWVLQRDLTVDDLLAADLNQNGFISKSEFVIYKLKEMGKIDEKDIRLICNQFNKLDPNNTGKITLPDLFSSAR